MKILIIDDEFIITDALGSYLKENHEVTLFNDSQKAFNHYEQNQHFNLIITDFLMPNLRGDELIEKVLKINSNQLIIVISGFFTKQFSDILIKFNANIRMIDKPIEPKELDLALETIQQ
ncbi:MAG: hypothetical protein COA79_00705 [Planctomycetota bacterium]|nr:MAG: hypothetical protein COA79_00705 [Planctomycetota bacterium]